MPPPLAVEVRHEAAVGEARRSARMMADALGFPQQAREEIALAATELATNLLKHAAGGTLTVIPIEGAARVGLELEASDSGPGIRDVEQALGDRYSSAGTRGTGLGAVNRLMDELDIDSLPGRGTRVVCRKWLREQRASVRPCPLDIGVASRARLSTDVNGDAFVVVHGFESVLVGVIDGLGHGHFAHRAALAARHYVQSHFDSPLDQIFRGTGRACRATRGVVMALARFDWGSGRLAFASVGNVLVRVFPRSDAFRFVVRRGVIGLNAPPPAVTEHDWPPGHMLVLHSDGVSTHWRWSDYPGWMDAPAAGIAQELLGAKAKAEDDATVLVVKEAAR